jgi:hypothetical protein
MTNTFRYVGLTPIANSGNIILDGQTVSAVELSGANFYRSILLWSDTVWDFSDLDFASRKFPRLQWEVT